jgi:hypothetical protein
MENLYGLAAVLAVIAAAACSSTSTCSIEENGVYQPPSDVTVQGWG